MIAVFEVVEQLAAAGLGPSRAVQHTRHLMDAGIIRRGSRGRPSSSSRSECTVPEVADIVLSLGAQLPIKAAQKARRLADYIPEPGPVVDELFALPEQSSTARAWLIAVLERLSRLSRDERNALYRAKPAPALTLYDEQTVPYPAADYARFEWGDRYINFRPPEPPMRDVLEEPLPPLRPIFSVVIEIGLLLRLTPPAAMPENEDAAALPGAAASPVPADAEQTLATARRQPGLSNPRLGVRASEGNRPVEMAGQTLPQEPSHAPRHRRRT